MKQPRIKKVIVVWETFDGPGLPSEFKKEYTAEHYCTEEVLGHCMSEPNDKNGLPKRNGNYRFTIEGWTGDKRHGNLNT